MKKLLLLGTLLASTAMQAQTTYYWPRERAKTLVSGTQYFIYNTAIDNGDRSVFLYSNGSAIRTTNVSPLSFITTEGKYLFTTIKPEGSDNTTNLWNLKSADGYVGPAGVTNNGDPREIYISYWYGNDNISKSSTAKSEDEQGVSQNPNSVDTKVFAITKADGKNTTAADDYAWNGNAAGESSWTRYSDAHPYAFYTVGSKTISAEALTYYNETTARNGIFADFAHLLQQQYGLVQDGDKYYYSNYPETTASENSFYRNLLDGNDGTYFHSSWSAKGEETDPKHYLRAQILEPTTNFYIITKRRCDNNNNRPTSILVEGSNEADANYAEIVTLQGLPTDANEYFYFSDEIKATAAYSYLRFTPQTINTGTRFFTYSEFYILPATEEVKNAMNTIKALYSMRNIKDETLTSESLIAAGNELDVQYEKIKFPVVQTEAQEVLSANASNHAEDPALGQYPTEAYNALQAAATTETTSEGLEEAIKAFKFSINAPVFTINGAFNGGYKTVGKSIYYKAGNATPLWWNKATNKYDKTMLWKFAGLTSETPETGSTYSLMNLSADVYLWGVENVQITETNPTNTDGIVLLKTEGYANPIHADVGGTIVRWDNSNPNSASAWTLEYVGESKIIESISEEEMTAAAGLNTLITECEPYSDMIGTGLHKFTCNGHDFAAALSNAKTALANLYSDPNVDVIAASEELRAAKEALTINQPETGKFYRFKNKVNNNYISSTGTAGNRPNMVDGNDVASTVFYLSADKKLTGSNLLNMSNYNFAGNNIGGETSFQASTAYPGCYLILNNDTAYYGVETGKQVDRWGKATEAPAKANCAWILEEVTDAALQPSLSKSMSAEYATLAAPVALNIPEGVKAYTVTVDADKATATLEEVSDVIPAGTAVVLKKTGSDSNFTFTFAAKGSTDNTNALSGVYTATTIAADANAYILANGTKGIGFYQMNADDRALGANKAYLVLPQEASAVRSIIFSDGTTTGIESTVAEGTEAEEYYDLQGRRVMNPTKGIYVTKSGKKVVINK